MAFGNIIRSNKRPFGSNYPAVSSGVPKHYPLTFYTHSLLGVPLYHFRSDWMTTPLDTNFTSITGRPAKVGDPVQKWKNAYLMGDEGAAKVPPPSLNGGNYWGTLSKDGGYPTLVEKTYSKDNQRQTLTGLKFTGLEYMQIDGASVTETYNIDEHLFTTAGTGLMTGSYNKSGASFLFVIDSDMIDYQEGDMDAGVDDRANGQQALLYGRKLNCMTTPGFPGYGNHNSCIGVPQGSNTINYYWPSNIEDYGLQIWFNNRNNDPNEVNNRFPGMGPEGGYINPIWSFETMQPKPILPEPTGGWTVNDGIGMGSIGALGNISNQSEPGAPPTVPGSDSPHLAPKMQSGFQILLFEIDNTYHHTYPSCLPICGVGDGYEIYTGPMMRLYTFGNDKYTQQVSVPWAGTNSLVTARSWGYLPAFQNSILFHEKLLFLAGFPPKNMGFGRLASGFRGTIYETMMFEGKLSDGDKTQLEEIFKKKYAQAIRP